MILMSLIGFIKKELDGWGKYERIFFPLTVITILLISIYLNDSKIALISAICGISYTIFAGKGKISCYFFGLMGTFCYSYIAFKNALYGNLILYMCYYFPMQVYGIFKWRNHLKPDTGEIVKTQLSKRERIYCFVGVFVLSAVFYFILLYLNDKSPLFDALTSIFSVLGLILTVKRCIEQWYVWFFVNVLSTLMWIEAYYNGSNCFATVLMWLVYTVLAVYFYIVWKKELSVKS